MKTLFSSFAYRIVRKKIVLLLKKVLNIFCGSWIYEINVSNLCPEKLLSYVNIDEKTIIKAAQKTGAVVSVEEHQIAGGFGSAIAECLARNYPVPQEFIGVKDRFGESGNSDELIEHFGMGIDSIKEAVKKAITRKTAR